MVFGSGRDYKQRPGRGRKKKKGHQVGHSRDEARMGLQEGRWQLGWPQAKEVEMGRWMTNDNEITEKRKGGR